MAIRSWLTAMYRRLTTRTMWSRQRGQRTAYSAVPAVVETLELRRLLSAFAVGDEFRVNTTTTYAQHTNGPGTVAMDAAGSFVITWSNSDHPADNLNDVYAQRYNAAGVAQGDEFRVNTTMAGSQYWASAAMSAVGDFVATWSSNHEDGFYFDVFAQRYNAVGEPQGSEFRVNTTTYPSQFLSTVAMDASGNFVIAWTSDQENAPVQNVYARRYNAAGVAQGNEFRVSTTATESRGIPTYPRVAMDEGGDFVITWQSTQDGNDYDVYARRYDAAGVTQGAEFRANTTRAAPQKYSSVAMDGAGEFVVSWSNYSQDGDLLDVYAQRYDAAGVAQGSEFRVNTTTANHQEDPSVAMNAAGDFVVTWQSSGQDGSSSGVYAQLYNAAGMPQGSEFRVNTYTFNDQRTPSVAMDAAGQFVVAWTSYLQDGSNDGVYAQRYQTSNYPSVEQVAAVLQRQTVTGATIITHGFQLSDSDGDSLAALAQAVRTRADTENGPNQTAWLLDYDLVNANGQFTGLFDANQSVFPSSEIPATGEVVLLFDWARESNESSAGWGEAAGDALFNLLVGLGLASPTAGTSVPLHLIGHSFGTAVISEAVERLATFSIPVDQVTYLDPHDFDQGILPVDGSQRLYELGKPSGYGATVWQNVAFTDVYYQTEFAPDGRPIPGAYNVLVNDQVSGIDAHSDVWNIVYKTTVSDPNSTTGYAFSRIAQQVTGSHPNLRDASYSQFRFYSAQQDHQHSSETLVDPDTGNANTQGLNQLGLTVDGVDFAAWLPATNPLEIVNGDFRHVGDELLPGWVDHGGGRVSAGTCPIFSVCGDALDGMLTLGARTVSRNHNRFFIPAGATSLLFDMKRTDASNDDQLVVRLGTQVVRTLSLNSFDGSFTTQTVEIPTALRDGSRTLEFTITAGGAGIDSEVQIDNVRLAANTRMYRAYNPNADFHFFTTSRAQFDNAVQAGYRDETADNSGFEVYGIAVTDARGTATPIYRVYNLQRGFHYYTLNLNEKNFLVNIVPPPVSGPDTRTTGWRDEGIEGYMYAAPAGSTAPAGTTLVHRLYNNNSGVHLFTQDINVRNAILAAFPGVWVQHDPLGYGFAVNASGQAAARRAPALAAVESRDESREMRGNLATTAVSLSTLDSRLSTSHSTSIWVGPLTSTGNGDVPPIRTRGRADVDFETTGDSRRFKMDRDCGSHEFDAQLLDRVWSDFGAEIGSLGEL
ncbi:MAG: hypothetical protein HZA46_18970 [Planctomycetales bacterium]|nr:hypothetical protein [Planctomycetales bacterium]